MKKGLLFLMLSMLSIGAWAQSSPYTGVAVGDIVSGNDYYLYNVESGLWLQNNDRTTNDWHTRGQLGTRGIDFQLNADGGGYKINGKFGKGSINHGNLYLDNNDNDVWVFESVSVGNVSNAVTISCSGTVLGARNYVRTYKAKNLFTEETESNYYLENQASESTKNNTWQIVTKEERLAKMGSATNQSPKDASWLIKSPDFANNDSRYSNWTRTGNWARGGDVNGDWGRGSMIMESWNSGSSVKISQTIADIPNGVYTLQLQGYYRDGMAGDNTDFNDRGCTNETCIEAKHNAGTEVIRAKYYANESEANLRSIIDETHTTAKTGPDCWNFTRLGNYYFPNDMQTAQRAMNIEKAYVNEPITVVVKDGKLEIGVEKTGSVAYDWVIIDNFKLTYYGPNITSGEDYYFYNVGSGLWLQNNDRKTSEFTTRAELGDRGMNVGISAITGGYQLNPHFGNGGNHSINGSGLYMDTSQGVTAWQIASVLGTDYVTIKAGSNFLGSDGSDNKYLTVSSSLSGNDSYWRMYTEEEYYNLRKTEMLTATQASPKDATWMITDPTFAAYDERETSWTRVNTGGNNDLQGDTPDRGGVKCNCVWEAWNSSSHSFQQELTNLPAGVYRMSVQGFYNSGANTYLPYYFVENTTSGKVQNNFMLASEGEHESTGGCATSAVLGGGDGQFWASKCIYNGHYQNQWIYFIVGSDNEETTIGVKKEGKNGEDWLVYDNFKLEYLGSGEISFNENNTSIDEIIGLATRITMTRSMQKDRWNTFCVPFAMTGSQITEQFGSGSQVKELSGAVQNGDHYTMNFTNADAIVAGKPYMVKPANNVSSIELTNASGIAVNTTGTPSVTEGGVTFTGVYANGKAPQGSFIISNNVFYKVDSDVTLKAFRGYITVPAVGVKALNFTFDDEPDAINEVNGQWSMVNGQSIYNLAGQRISKMQKGINIVNGKKILK